MTAPRLCTLTPGAVAAEVVGAVHGLVRRRSVDIGLGDPVLPMAPVPPLGHLASLLTVWAQDGANADGWDWSRAWQASTDLAVALYLPAVGRASDDAPHSYRGSSEPETAAEVVLTAAWARVLIAQRTDVPVRALASLASLGIQSVRNLGSTGELAIHDGLVGWSEAARWLGGRGVPGL